MQKSVEVISEMDVVSFAHSCASEGKQALHMPPAPGMARAVRFGQNQVRCACHVACGSCGSCGSWR